MRRAIIFLCLGVIGSILYMASPFVAAWRLREAIKYGDTAFVEQKVEWDLVRASLKESLTKHADLIPPDAFDRRPTLWQRVKGLFGHSVVDRFVETYVTPQGLTQLASYRKSWREKVKGEPDERLTLAWHQRFQQFWARLKRAEFQSLGRIEFEMADRDNPERHYVSAMELIGFEWKMTSLRIKVIDAASRLTELERNRS